MRIPLFVVYTKAEHETPDMIFLVVYESENALSL